MAGVILRARAIFRTPPNKRIPTHAETRLLGMGLFLNVYDLVLRKDSRSREFCIGRSGVGGTFSLALVPKIADILGISKFLSTTFRRGAIRDRETIS